MMIGSLKETMAMEENWWMATVMKYNIISVTTMVVLSAISPVY